MFCRLCNLPSSAGIGPLNSFSERSRYANSEQLSSAAGIRPDNRLPEMSMA
eukprot:Gb_19708 [translate_table: standard]